MIGETEKLGCLGIIFMTIRKVYLRELEAPLARDSGSPWRGKRILSVDRKMIDSPLLSQVEPVQHDAHSSNALGASSEFDV